jgi:hypothetical protein
LQGFKIFYMNVTRACSTPFSHAYRRFSESKVPFPDQHLAKVFKERHRHTGDEITLRMVLLYPKTLTNYWRVAKSMQKKGLVPFVHGQAMVWAIPQRILKALGFQGCQLLRSQSLKTSHEITQLLESELSPKIHTRFFSFLEAGKPPDYHPELGPYLLAVTLGLFHLGIRESPFSFVFGGAYNSHSGFNTYELEGNRSALPLKNCIIKANCLISQALEEKGVDSETSTEVLQSLPNLYDEAARQPIGQILVCGVPFENLDTTVYHCKPLGIPTGISINKIIEDLEQPNPHGYQARLMLCRETRHIDVVNIMDQRAVQTYSQGLDLLPPDQEEGLRHVIDYPYTEQEDEHLRALTQLYEKIDKLAQKFNL